MMLFDRFLGLLQFTLNSNNINDNENTVINDMNNNKLKKEKE